MRSRMPRLASGLAAGTLAVLGASAAVGSGDVDPVSLTPGGSAFGNNDSTEAAISANGRFVAFTSDATDLVDSDTNARTDVFLRDRRAGVTTRVSVSSSGTEGDNFSRYPAISGNGRWIVYYSAAENLVLDDANGFLDVFVFDRKTGETERVSVAADRTEGDGHSSIYGASISANGRWVAFESSATNLAPAGGGPLPQVFVKDRKTGEVTLVSRTDSGGPGAGQSQDPSLSANGRFVAYHSTAPDLVPVDTNGVADVFVFDRKTEATRRASVDSDGNQGNSGSFDPAVSGNGNVVAFFSIASNLVADDTNGDYDVFVHDFRSMETRRLSERADGSQAAGDSYTPAITANGKVVVFYTEGAGGNLVPEDTNGTGDVYAFDLPGGTLRLLSVNAEGQPGDGYSYVFGPSLSSNGRWLVFSSGASNLVAGGDTNLAYDDFVVDPRR